MATVPIEAKIEYRIVLFYISFSCSSVLFQVDRYRQQNNQPQYTDAERKCHKKDTESGILHIAVESCRINRTVFVIDLEISCEERQIEKTTERDQK